VDGVEGVEEGVLRGVVSAIAQVYAAHECHQLAHSRVPAAEEQSGKPFTSITIHHT